MRLRPRKQKIELYSPYRTMEMTDQLEEDSLKKLSELEMVEIADDEFDFPDAAGETEDEWCLLANKAWIQRSAI